MVKGQIIADSGQSVSEFDHLHFEIRDGGLLQKNCIHPLNVLPYADSQLPAVSFTSVNASNPLLPAAEIIELLDQPRLADVLRGTDVRAIVGGHYHSTSHSTFAGIPVSVAAATCYLADPATTDRFISASHRTTSAQLRDDSDVHVVATVVTVSLDT